MRYQFRPSRPASRATLLLAVALLSAALAAPFAPAQPRPQPATAATAARLPLDTTTGQPMATLSPIIKKASPAVVNIATRGTVTERGQRNPLLDDPFFRRFFEAPGQQAPRERQFQSAGSGVVVDAQKGLVLTNAHVVEHATEITVTTMDGHDYKGEIVGADAASDIAVVRVKNAKLTELPVGDFVQSRGRRLRGRDRQPVRTAAHRHFRHRQRARPLGNQPRRLRGLHPDRRVDQSGQLRRRSHQSAAS